MHSFSLLISNLFYFNWLQNDQLLKLRDQDLVLLRALFVGKLTVVHWHTLISFYNNFVFSTLFVRLNPYIIKDFVLDQLLCSWSEVRVELKHQLKDPFELRVHLRMNFTYALCFIKRLIHVFHVFDAFFRGQMAEV